MKSDGAGNDATIARAAASGREKETHYRELFDSMDEGYCIIEMLFDDQQRAVDYRFVEVNRAFEAQSGLREVVGRRMLEFVPSIEQHWLTNYGQVAITGEPIRFANEYKTLHRWFDVYAFRVGAAHERKVAVLFSDITRRRQAELALIEAGHRKDEFLAMLAHELRNPLSAIRNAVQILMRTGGDADTVRFASEILDRQVGHMVRQVDDLLDVSRISRGKIELRKERAELASIVNHAVEAIRPECESARHDLVIQLPAQPIELDADPIRLAQVVGNLLSNACKFTDPGGRIWLTVERAGDQAVVRVRDTGIGLAPDQLGRIFDIFAQIDNSLERARSGLGLGLTLVKKLVEAHGGTVEARSAGLGQGSEFIVTLPVLPAPKVERAIATVESEPASAARRRILVVDDNRDSAKSLAMLLKVMGHEVDTAHDGLEAVARAMTFRADVILLDIGLPRLNGYEAARRIRQQQHEKGLKLVALTGWGQEEDRRRSGEAGFDAHFVKPVDLTALTKLLAEWE